MNLILVHFILYFIINFIHCTDLHFYTCWSEKENKKNKMDSSQLLIDVEGGIIYTNKHCVDLFAIRSYWNSIITSGNHNFDEISPKQFTEFVINTFGIKSFAEKQKNKDFKEKTKKWMSWPDFFGIMANDFRLEMPTTKPNSPKIQRFIENEI